VSEFIITSRQRLGILNSACPIQQHLFASLGVVKATPPWSVYQQQAQRPIALDSWEVGDHGASKPPTQSILQGISQQQVTG
jgi:hypothetical protein